MGAQVGGSLGSAPLPPLRGRTGKPFRPASSSLLAYPDRIAKNRGGGVASCSPTAVARDVDPASALARDAFHRGRRTDRHRRAAAASCWLRRSRWRRSRRASPTRSKTDEEISFDRAALSLRARRRERLRRDHACRSAGGGRADDDDRAHARRRIARLGIWTACHGRSRSRNGATASCSCARAEGEEWPDLSDAALVATADDVAGARAVRQDRADGIVSRRSGGRAAGAAAMASARAGWSRGADAFRGADGLDAARSTTKPRRGRSIADPRAGIVRPDDASVDRAAARCRW